MFSCVSKVDMKDRTVGVVHLAAGKAFAGLTLFNQGVETFLIDEDGRAINTWRSKRTVFASYLLPNGHLVRDGNDSDLATTFNAGGAAGYIEEVTWENELVWSFAALPYSRYLTHHDIEPMPNGHVLVLLWERRTKEECIRAGRKSEFLPDDEVWDQMVWELAPNGRGGADVVWQWSLFDHLVQDADPSKENFGQIHAHPELFDINACPPGGKLGCRNQGLVGPRGRLSDTAPDSADKITGFCQPRSSFGATGTGEKDWSHCNGLCYDAHRDQIIQSFNIHSEILIIDHSTTTDEARGHSGGRYGRGGDFLFRWGNPSNYRCGTRTDQMLYNQHSCRLGRVNESGFSTSVLVFNNGRVPDRHWSSVDELELPEEVPGSGIYTLPAPGMAFGPEKFTWSYGPRVGRLGSFYCTHISCCERLDNGNTLVVQGPQGIITEVTPSGEEVWRYVVPVSSGSKAKAVCITRQGDERVLPSDLSFTLFQVKKYPLSYAPFVERGITPEHRRRCFYLEAYP
mmetsp:Transcript_65744/g.183099  ORF Transcript_65744/g.183099 Transcript_65744/m.183099 type:complete len:513 (+) Transcript_65744:69-1607(+)